MRIAFVSYEFPPDTGVGGIATYVKQISQMMSTAGIGGEVVCASPEREGRTEENEMLAVTRVRCRNTEEFREISPSVGARSHAKNPIDLIEAAGDGGAGMQMKQALPDVPLVVKLHTPRYLIKKLNDHYYDRKFVRRIKRGLGMVYKKE